MSTACLEIVAGYYCRYRPETRVYELYERQTSGGSSPVWLETADDRLILGFSQESAAMVVAESMNLALASLKAKHRQKEEVCVTDQN